MKIAVIGSRSIIDEEIVKKIMFPEFAYQNNILITGGAPGVDSIALKVAETNEIEYEIIRPVEKESLPEWNYKLLYIFRNIEIITKADRIIAIWDGKSKGTKFVTEALF